MQSGAPRMAFSAEQEQELCVCACACVRVCLQNENLMDATKTQAKGKFCKRTEEADCLAGSVEQHKPFSNAAGLPAIVLRDCEMIVWSSMSCGDHTPPWTFGNLGVKFCKPP